MNVSIEASDEDVLDYIYGVIHSPTYRFKFRELLKDDFPVIPVAADDDEFKVFRDAGSRLRKLHLMRDPAANAYVTSYPVASTDVVERYALDGEQVWINGAQYFGGVTPEVWEFEIGAY